jgi:exodeoxyribonuclease-3
MTRLATWNVNSLKVRLPQVLAWLAAQQPDVLCLQETKMEDGAFPVAQIEAAGYRALYAGQKTYNGVALLSREALQFAAAAIPDFADEQKRILAADLGETRIVCAYFPNGQEVGCDKYAYKLRWLEALTGWLGRELADRPQLALLGDFNIAPEERDVHDPQLWAGRVLFSEPEREAFRRLVALGLADAFRLFEQPERSYSWWDYRMAAFRRNLGLRIDHILLSAPLAGRCSACSIDRLPRKAERPSDHAPVLCELAP